MSTLKSFANNSHQLTHNILIQSHKCMCMSNFFPQKKKNISFHSFLQLYRSTQNCLLVFRLWQGVLNATLGLWSYWIFMTPSTFLLCRSSCLKIAIHSGFKFRFGKLEVGGSLYFERNTLMVMMTDPVWRDFYTRYILSAAPHHFGEFM